MEVDCKTKESIKKVRDKVTSVRWTIEDFISQSFSAGDEGLQSDKFALDEESTDNFELQLLCPIEFDDSSYLLDLHPFNFEPSFSKILEVECKFWIENSKGEKYAETETRKHVFIREDEENCCEFHSFLDKFQMLEEFVFKDGRAIICGEIKRLDSSIEIDLPKIDSNLRSNLWSAHQKGLINECKIKVDGKQFKVPKIILAANSDVFERMLLSKNYNEAMSEVIEIKDTSFEVIHAFIEYLHRGQLDNLTNLCDELFVMANKYNVPQLQSDCLDVMLENLNKNNVFERLKLAFTHNEDKLKNAVLDYILSPTSDLNSRQILESDAWYDFLVKETLIAKEITAAIFEKTNWIATEK